MDFMILGLPRTGTTWMSNWLTDDKAICLHDPLSEYDLKNQRLSIPTSKKIGVSCTGMWMFNYCEKYNCNTLKLTPDLELINKELKELGINDEMDQKHIECFNNTRKNNSINYSIKDITTNFNVAHIVWNWLRPSEHINRLRWEVLRKMHIQPIHDLCTPNPEILRSQIIDLKLELRV